MATASLVVKISADINDFAKQLNKMTKDVDKAAERIQHLGANMTIGITVPVLAATAALAHLAMENDRVGAQFERVFGEGASRAHQQIAELAKIIPEANTELEEMFIRTKNLVEVLGIAPEQARALSAELIKMSAGFAAFAGMDQSEALDGLVKGMEGAMRSLKKLGLKKEDVELEAFRLGLTGVGRELTATGQALAVYSLLQKKSSVWGQEAAKVAQSSQVQFHMMLRDVRQLADDLSMALIPAMRRIVGMFREFLAIIRETPTWLIKTIAVMLGLAATLGPTIWLMAKLVATVHLLRQAWLLLMAAKGLGVLGTFLVAPEVLGALALLAAALGTVAYLWYKFNKTVEATPDVGGVIAPPPTVAELLKLGGTNDATSVMKGNPFEQFQKAGQLAQSAFDMAVSSGDDLQSAMDGVLSIQKQAYSWWERSSDKMGEMAQQALKMYFTMRDIALLRQVGTGEVTAARASAMMMPATQIHANFGKGLVDEQTALRVREHALKQVDQFDATRVALIEFGEALRDTAHNLAKRAVAVAQPTRFQDILTDANLQSQENAKSYAASLMLRTALLALPSAFDAAWQASVELGEQFRAVGEVFQLGWEKLKQQWGSGGAITAGVMAGLEAGLTGAMEALGPFALILMAVNKVLEPIMGLIQMVMEPLTALGQIIALILIPIMKPLFEALKVLGIGVSIVGEVFYRVAAAIQQAVGGLIKGLGKLIGKIPGLGGVGKSIQKLGDWFLGMADESKKAAADLKKARDQLIKLQFGETYDALGNLTDAANSASEALLNVPTGVRLAFDRFLATLPASPLPDPGTALPAQGSVGGGSSGGEGIDGGDGAFALREQPIILQMDGQTVGKVVVKGLMRRSFAQFGTTARWAEVSV